MKDYSDLKELAVEMETTDQLANWAIANSRTARFLSTCVLLFTGVQIAVWFVPLDSWGVRPLQILSAVGLLFSALGAVALLLGISGVLQTQLLRIAVAFERVNFDDLPSDDI